MKEGQKQLLQTEIQAWKALEDLRFLSQYLYPGAELPRRHLREGTALGKFLPKSCKGIFLDYGCGEGPTFRYIKQYYKKYLPFIIGIDPDYHRLMRAKDVLQDKGGRGIFFNTTFQNQIFCKPKLANSIFCIICIQVLGHISDYQFRHVIKIFHFLLKRGGTLILAVPVVNNDFNLRGWVKGKDVFYITNLLLNKKDPGFRKTCSLNEFSNFVNNPQLNSLPTRSFFINDMIKKEYISNKTEIAKSSLGKILSKYRFIIKKAMIYRVKFNKGHGDLMMSSQKK